MSKHKKQHYVPKCYLKAWCDPECPRNHTPYIWIFDKDSKSGRRKAPDNIFHQTDMYTIHDEEGKRHLDIEHGLSGLERHFSTTRNKTLNHRRDLDTKERVILTTFIAATHARTKSQLSHMADQWRRPLEMMDRINEQLQTATEEEKRKMASISASTSSDDSDSLSHEQVRQMVEDPVGTMLLPMIEADAPLLANLDMAILCTESKPGFITSDRPCVWFDPEGYKRPPIYRGPALMYETIEITLPISPRQCILLNRQGVTGYIDIDDRAVDELNRMQRFQASEYYVVNQDSVKDYWFEMGEEPDNSWEKQQERNEANKSVNTDS